jgi:YHS domain-containing protein
VLQVPLTKREVSLLLEHLARRGGLGPICHLAGRLDLLGKLGPQAVTLENEARAGNGMFTRHARIVPEGGPGSAARSDILRGSTWRSAMAIAIDPVCGMQVDTETSDLKLEHDGKTYWFCGKGCLLEFKDDPEKYLAPGYEPSM